MADVRITLTGTTPLILHNGQLADPDNPISKEIAKFTSKNKKTEEDRREIGRLEWYGGLYLQPGIEGPVMPTGALLRMFANGAKITRQGKSIERALSFRQSAVPIVYDGPRAIDKLWEDPKYQYRTSVRVQMSRVMRMRPQFPEWAIIADAYVVEAAIDLDALRRIVELSGVVEGLCENRRNGFGRFSAEVIEL